MPYSKAELAARWRVTVRTIDRWTKDGIIQRMVLNPARGGKVLFADDEVKRVEMVRGLSSA